MIKKALMAFLPLMVLIAIPVLLRPSRPVVKVERKLVIISPHTESIRYEFEQAFAAHYLETHGEAVAIEWRTPGGTSDIVRYIDDQFMTNFGRYWQARTGSAPPQEVLRAFNNRRVTPDSPDATELEKEARAAFLESEVGIGIDIFFGGGWYEMDKQAKQGYAVDAGMIDLHPEWFSPDVIPQTHSGEIFYDPQGRYYGTCLAAFGICYSPDRVAMLADDSPPTHWSDLGEPRFYRQAGVADPTKSGSITKCFEMLIQQAMQEAASRARAAGESEDEALVDGWREGLNLIKRIGGNARYVTDSASKVPHDVGRGDTTVGMCIDFYGRSEAEWTAFQSGGRERVVYVTPEGGSSLSVDPILMFRGAPNRDLAVAFIEFTLSEAGQKLWNYRVGTPGGPRMYALRRLPVRRDMFTPEHRRYMSDPDEEPFEETRNFVYRPQWTAAYFGLIRTLIRCMILDPGLEVNSAWGAIIAAGGPEAVPLAAEAFNRLPFTYAQASDANARLYAMEAGDVALSALELQREWARFFRANYAEAERLARTALQPVAGSGP